VRSCARAGAVVRARCTARVSIWFSLAAICQKCHIQRDAVLYSTTARDRFPHPYPSRLARRRAGRRSCALRAARITLPMGEARAARRGHGEGAPARPSVKRSRSGERAARASRSRAHPPTAAAVVRRPFESRGVAVDEPERRRAVLSEAHGLAVDEMGVETLRQRRLRPDAVACPRCARHRVGSSAGRRGGIDRRCNLRDDAITPSGLRW